MTVLVVLIFALKARTALKYSYVVLYYMEDSEKRERRLFEYLQEDLEKAVEKLTDALEVSR